MRARPQTLAQAPWRASSHGTSSTLLRVAFAKPPQSTCGAGGSLTPPFHPIPPGRIRGRSFSVALSRGSPVCGSAFTTTTLPCKELSGPSSTPLLSRERRGRWRARPPLLNSLGRQRLPHPAGARCRSATAPLPPGRPRTSRSRTATPHRGGCGTGRRAARAAPGWQARVLIGVTWLTSTIVRCGCAASSRSSAPRTRRAAIAKLSPPGGAASAAGQPGGHLRWPLRGEALFGEGPGHSTLPKSASTRSSSTCSGAPVASATASAVRRARCSGDVTITSMPPREDRRLAAAAAPAAPARLGQRDIPSPGESAPPADSGVWPCRSSSVVVGVPCGGPQAGGAATG